MTIKTVVPLPLFEDFFYSYEVSIQDNSYTIEIVYNSYSTLWSMSLYTEDRVPIVMGMTLIPGYPIASDYAIYPLTGYFLLSAIPSITTEKYKEEPEALSQYYTLRYVLN